VGGFFGFIKQQRDSNALPHSRDTMRPSFAKFISPQKKEGAGDPQERARGRPGARCTRGLACKSSKQKTHTSIQVQRKQSGLPRAMV
jgi:hypothetical protein